MSKGLSYFAGLHLQPMVSSISRDNLKTGAVSPQNSYNYAAKMGNRVFVTHRPWSGTSIWELPFRSGQNPSFSGPNFAARWLGGWQLNGIVTYANRELHMRVTANNDGYVDGQ